MRNVIYVQTEEELRRAAEEWAREKDFGVDTESENNLHHYGVYLSTVQISTASKHWVVDVIKLRDITPVIRLLEDPTKQKIFHDVSFDYRILKHQFKCRPANVFDTQIAAKLLGKKELGLGALLKEYFHIEKVSKFQRSDWTKRPLTQEQIEYASKDTQYLIQLRNILRDELVQKGRLAWAEEEFSLIEKRDYGNLQGTMFSIDGLNKLSETQLAVFRRLFNLREHLAQKADRPSYFIIRTSKLVELAANPPKSEHEWAQMRGVHPIVRRYAAAFYREVMEGRKERLALPKMEKRHRMKTNERLEKLIAARNDLAKKLGMQPHIILSREQAEDIVRTGTLEGLTNWQAELIQENIDLISILKKGGSHSKS
ncbi:MAG: HRDC domain-containing protein [Candidatus Micrarchaeota archaeon]|nr:HRDC domain-containing protein [Candidatus Micrarchaeota archaeon]